MRYNKYLIFTLIVFVVFIFNISCSTTHSVEKTESNVKLQLVPKTKLNPFFKVSDQDYSHLPLAPQLSQFDKAILKVCGPWGSKPKLEDLRDVLNDKRYEESVNNIYNALNKQIETPNAGLDQFKEELLNVWFRNKAFEHVFCGEPKPNKLGGFHFAGRYLEAQQKQFAGLVDKNDIQCKRKKEVHHPIYTIGVVYKYGNEVKKDCVKGFDISLNAEKLFINATKAYKQLFNKSRGGILSNKNKQCLYDSHNNKYDYKSVFVARDGSIVTFYPTLRPKCNFGVKECSCE